MDIDATFLPVAVDLIDNVFPTPIEYFLTGAPSYDPATGEVTPDVVQISINAGVLSRGRVEAGGPGEEYELRLWIQHSGTGLRAVPTTADRVLYDGVYWKVVTVDPTYSSDALIASRLVLRAE
jgi:hypothetical protein